MKTDFGYIRYQIQFLLTGFLISGC